MLPAGGSDGARGVIGREAPAERGAPPREGRVGRSGGGTWCGRLPGGWGGDGFAGGEAGGEGDEEGEKAVDHGMECGREERGAGIFRNVLGESEPQVAQACREAPGGGRGRLAWLGAVWGVGHVC